MWRDCWAAMQLCEICSEQPPKYRCPVCKVRYCSLGCFKNHKLDSSCQPVTDTTPSVPTPPLQTCPSGAEALWEVDDLLDQDSQSDRVPLQKLQKLGESTALLGLLHNPHLRNLMMSVDSSEDKAQAMRKAMQEPLFVEFANQCLQIIEPPERRVDLEEEEDDWKPLNLIIFNKMELRKQFYVESFCYRWLVVFSFSQRLTFVTQCTNVFVLTFFFFLQDFIVLCNGSDLVIISQLKNLYIGRNTF